MLSPTTSHNPADNVVKFTVHTVCDVCDERDTHKVSRNELRALTAHKGQTVKVMCEKCWQAYKRFVERQERHENDGVHTAA